MRATVGLASLLCLGLVLPLWSDEATPQKVGGKPAPKVEGKAEVKPAAKADNFIQNVIDAFQKKPAVKTPAKAAPPPVAGKAADRLPEAKTMLKAGEKAAPQAKAAPPAPETVVVKLPEPAKAPAPNPPPARKVLELIDFLASNDYRTREAASKALETLGTDLLPAYRYYAHAHPDPEARKRLEDLLPRLEVQVAITPKLVTLSLEKKPAREAIQEIAKQTGYKITLWPEAQFNGDREKGTFTFKMDKVPFWDALDRVCEVAGLSLEHRYYGDNEGLRLNFQDNYSPYVYRSGPFRLVADGFHYSRSVNFGSVSKNPAQVAQRLAESLNFNFNICVEPKLPLLGLGQVRLVAALDDQKNSMIVPSNPEEEAMWGGPLGVRRYYRYGGYRSFCQDVNLALTWPSKSARKVSYLKGSVPVTLLTEQRPHLVIDKILDKGQKGKKYQAGTTSILVEDVQESGNAPGNKMYTLKLTVQDSGKDNNGDYSWSNSLYQRLELQDEKGNKLFSRGMNWGSSSPNSVSGSFMFGDIGNGPVKGPPARLVYHHWVTLDYELTFEFRDLPLP